MVCGRARGGTGGRFIERTGQVEIFDLQYPGFMQGRGTGLQMVPGLDDALYGLGWSCYFFRWDRHGKFLPWDAPSNTCPEWDLKAQEFRKKGTEHSAAGASFAYVPVSMTMMPHMLSTRWSDGHLFVLHPPTDKDGARELKAMHEYLTSGKELTTPDNFVIWKVSVSATLLAAVAIAAMVSAAEHSGPIPGQPAGAKILDISSYRRYRTERQAVFIRLESGENVPLETHFGGQEYAGIFELLAKRRMTTSQMTGASFDRQPLKAALDDIHAVAPDFGWGFFGHRFVTKVWDKPCGYHTFVYHNWDGWDGEGQLKHKYGWKWEPGKIVGELRRPAAPRRCWRTATARYGAACLTATWTGAPTWPASTAGPPNSTRRRRRLPRNWDPASDERRSDHEESTCGPRAPCVGFGLKSRRSQVRVRPDGKLVLAVAPCNLAVLDPDGGIPNDKYAGPKLGNKGLTCPPPDGRGGVTTFNIPYLAAAGDCKSIYLTGIGSMKYINNAGSHAFNDHALYRAPLPGRGPAEVVFGDPAAAGNDDKHLSDPRGVALDSKGHILVADFGNNRVVVLNEKDKTVAGTFPVEAPFWVAADPKSGAVYVGSKQSALVKFSGWGNAKEVARADFAALLAKIRYNRQGVPVHFALDSSAQPPVLWAGCGGALVRFEDQGGKFAEPQPGGAYSPIYPWNLSADPLRREVSIQGNGLRILNGETGTISVSRQPNFSGETFLMHFELRG